MSKRRWLLLAILVAAYLFTWVGGSISHSSRLEAYAQRCWNDGVQRNREMAQLAADEGLDWHPIKLREGGPSTHVDWCVPLLPGVLLADSSYVIAPLWGKGGVKVVLFYGFGSVEVLTPWCWIS